MPGGGAIYFGAKESLLLSKVLENRGVPIYVRLLDLALSEAGLVLVSKEDRKELDDLRSKVKQLESILNENT
jgi:hypothetical protein